MLNQFAKWLTRKPAVVLFISVLLLIPAYYGTEVTRINYDVLSYLPRDKEAVKGQDILEEVFHNAATSMVILDEKFDKEVLTIKEKIERLDGIHSVISIRDAVGLQVPKEFIPQSLRETFYSEKGTILIVKYEEDAASEKTMENIAEIRKIVDEKVHITGLSVFLADLKNLVHEEMPKYIFLAVFLSFIVLALCVDSWLLPIIFLISIFFGIAYNFGTNLFLGEISYVTQAIAAILQLAVTMDYSIFVIHRYDEEKNRFSDKRDAMATAITSAFQSLSGSSLTTVAGFFALCFMDFTLGKDIGIVMMKGVFFGLLTCITVLPAFILLFDGPIHKYTHKSLIPPFERLTDFIMKYKKTAILLFLLTFIPAFYMQSKTEVYYNIDESLPKSLPSNVANMKLKKDFNMATSHFAIIKEDMENDKLERMVKELEEVSGVKNIASYNKFIGEGVPTYFVPESIRDIFKKDGKQMLMINSYYKPASEEANRQVEEMKKILKGYDETALLTGEAPLTRELSEIVDRDIKVTNLLSILAIFIIIGVSFRSLTVPLILVGCIELAIFINMGFPYALGTTIPFVSPIVIGAIQLGATVDYSILMTTRFREEIRRGLDKKEAIRIATKESAKSIVTSAFVFFAATTGVVFISSMDIIKSICEMLARGALISAAVILFILPPLLYVCEEMIEKTSYRWKTGGIK